MEFLISFLLGLGFVFFYYKLVWVSSKIKSKELKLEVKFGKNSPLLGKFKRKHKRFYYSRLFRFGLFALFTYVIWYLFGKQGLLGFFIALIAGNLLLFPFGWIKSSKNLKRESS